MVAGSRKRRAALGGAALLGAAFAVWLGAAAGGHGLDGDARPRAAVTGLRATLVDEETPLEAGGVAWRTRWRLCWSPIPGASGYHVTVVTSEGVSPEPLEVSSRCYTLTVASGTARRPGERPGRSAQLGLMEVMLSVSVAARYADGTTGPWSPDFAVGEPHP